MTTTDDDHLAAELAEEAGRRLLTLRAGGGDADHLRKAGDRESHEFLTAQLAARRPGDAVLSEEGRDDPARLSADRVWIVDPLDGTREFGEPGRTDWAVHVALWERGSLTAGAVALPAQGQVLATDKPPVLPSQAAIPAKRPAFHPAPVPASPHVAWPAQGPREPAAQAREPAARAREPAAQDREAAARGLPSLRVVVSRTRPPVFLHRLADVIDVTLIPLGSAGAKAAAVLRGEADAYVHSGGQHEWDSAAPVAVARAAGLHASRLDGSALAYNQPDPVLPDILICPVGLAGALLDAIGAARR